MPPSARPADSDKTLEQCSNVICSSRYIPRYLYLSTVLSSLSMIITEIIFKLTALLSLGPEMHHIRLVNVQLIKFPFMTPIMHII